VIAVYVRSSHVTDPSPPSEYRLGSNSPRDNVGGMCSFFPLATRGPTAQPTNSHRRGRLTGRGCRVVAARMLRARRWSSRAPCNFEPTKPRSRPCLLSFQFPTPPGQRAARAARSPRPSCVDELHQAARPGGDSQLTRPPDFVGGGDVGRAQDHAPALGGLCDAAREERGGAAPCLSSPPSEERGSCDHPREDPVPLGPLTGARFRGPEDRVPLEVG